MATRTVTLRLEEEVYRELREAAVDGRRRIFHELLAQQLDGTTVRVAGLVRVAGTQQ